MARAKPTPHEATFAGIPPGSGRTGLGCAPLARPPKIGQGATTVALTAVLAPLLAELLSRFRVPMVVLEILLGMAVGPHGLALVRDSPLVGSLSLLGLCFLFFMAGLEIDFFKIHGRPLKSGTKGWFISLALAVSLCLLLNLAGWIFKGSSI